MLDAGLPLNHPMLWSHGLHPQVLHYGEMSKSKWPTSRRICLKKVQAVSVTGKPSIDESCMSWYVVHLWFNIFSSSPFPHLKTILIPEVKKWWSKKHQKNMIWYHGIFAQEWSLGKPKQGMTATSPSSEENWGQDVCTDERMNLLLGDVHGRLILGNCVQHKSQADMVMESRWIQTNWLTKLIS